MKQILLFLALTLAATTGLTAAPAAPTGLYVGKTLNRQPLPRIETVPSENGWKHWLRLEQSYVTLRPDGRFIASFKYYRQHLAPKKTARPGPLLNESYKGSFSIKGTQITFKPDPVKGKPRPPVLIGSISGTRLSIPYMVSQAQSRHPLKLDLVRQGAW